MLFPFHLSAELNQLSCAEDDVILFYYSGHGYRTASKKDNPWPSLYFSISGKEVDFHNICQKLAAKKPRFLLAIADCCNNVLPESGAAPLVPLYASSKSQHTRIKHNYRRLFLENNGSLLVASSSVGEYSWCYQKGAVFTLALLDSLKALATAKSASWEALLDTTAEAIADHQTPFYLLSPEMSPD